MNANELADELDNMLKAIGLTNNRIPIMLRQQQEKLNKYELRHAEQRKRIDELEAYQKHDVELAEAIGWDKGYEAGRKMGMQQERALWELAASTQEIMDTQPVKELTREDRLKLIGTLKWAEDLLRDAGHDEAVSDVQDCLIILKKGIKK